MPFKYLYTLINISFQGESYFKRRNLESFQRKVILNQLLVYRDNLGLLAGSMQGCCKSYILSMVASAFSLEVNFRPVYAAQTPFFLNHHFFFFYYHLQITLLEIPIKSVEDSHGQTSVSYQSLHLHCNDWHGVSENQKSKGGLFYFNFWWCSLHANSTKNKIK